MVEVQRGWLITATLHVTNEQRVVIRIGTGDLLQGH